ncbi:MAG TPA: menaquinone biosynthesis protein [Planctomycetota bacterium]|nr:menaquinone biosynthesis protein [Planctomycetota bacterium]
MANRVRIGAPPMMNNRPLIWGLKEKLAGKGTLVQEKPPVVVEKLRAAELDVALIPSLEYLRNSDYEMVPEACVSARGPLMSAILICRRPPAAMETVALDTASSSAAALCRIILHKMHSANPSFIDWSPDIPLESVNAEGFLVFGDTAIKMWPRYEHIIDLGEEWLRLTDLPFVYDVWAGPSVSTPTAKLLQEAKRQGLHHLSRIAWMEAERLDLPTSICLDHLTNRIHYDFGEAEREGLSRFQRLAAEMELCPSPSEREVPILGT